jgi:hypothetical protein
MKPSQVNNPLLMHVIEARRKLGLNNPRLADFLGCSVRTIYRHHRTGGFFMQEHYQALIRALHPIDRPLTAQIAQLTRHDLVAMGLETAVSVGPAPSKARPEHADAVVYAAADALGLPPRQARPAVLAVFARATELGLDLPGLASLFAAERPAPKGSSSPS